MKGSIQGRVAFASAAFGVLAWLASAGMAQAQAASHFLGTVTAINGDTLTVKTAQGEDHQVQVPSKAELKRIEPGQTSLSAAAAMQFSELATGDRVLVWLDPESTGGTPQALRVVAIKEADLAKKHDEEQAEWQEHGVGGLVKSIDPATGAVVIASGAPPAVHTVTIHTSKTTILKRYAPASVSYSAAHQAPFDAIHVGDEVMARGTKNATGTEIDAEEVVSGSFRNISGLIVSLDPAHSTFVVKDLATKKPVTVQVQADAQMRQLPERMAQLLAARLKGAAAGTGGGERGQAGNGGGFRQSGAGAQRGGGGDIATMDPQRILNRAPAIHFSDLQKGEAVMLVATPGESEATAITLIAGVEPLLEAPASQDLLANWSMGSSGAEGAADAGAP